MSIKQTPTRTRDERGSMLLSTLIGAWLGGMVITSLMAFSSSGSDAVQQTVADQTTESHVAQAVNLIGLDAHNASDGLVGRLNHAPTVSPFEAILYVTRNGEWVRWAADSETDDLTRQVSAGDVAPSSWDGIPAKVEARGVRIDPAQPIFGLTYADHALLAYDVAIDGTNVELQSSQGLGR